VLRRERQTPRSRSFAESFRAHGTLLLLRDWSVENSKGNSEGNHEMLPTILIALLILLLIGEASARRPAAERSAVANKAEAERRRRASS
jgi:hypothetical protein